MSVSFVKFQNLLEISSRNFIKQVITSQKNAKFSHLSTGQISFSAIPITGANEVKIFCIVPVLNYEKVKYCCSFLWLDMY